MREGKNREVKNVLGHLGLRVNRLIRVAFGPFQLGELPAGAIVEVKTRALREALGERIVALAGADFSGPIEAREAPRGPGASRAPPSRDEGKRQHRRGDDERHGPPELARREKRRGWRGSRGPGGGRGERR
jgi:23S rRNA pseudouridine2605 synthase